mmetsp:Transcript_2112/g.4905  ORF Transcript_2112/g.4905 Transcript_2112/m.4905 type:complete len:227 (-) Transcript_2112:274-954(-)
MDLGGKRRWEKQQAAARSVTPVLARNDGGRSGSSRGAPRAQRPLVSASSSSTGALRQRTNELSRTAGGTDVAERTSQEDLTLFHSPGSASAASDSDADRASSTTDRRCIAAWLLDLEARLNAISRAFEPHEKRALAAVRAQARACNVSAAAARTSTSAAASGSGQRGLMKSAPKGASTASAGQEIARLHDAMIASSSKLQIATADMRKFLESAEKFLARPLPSSER